jgi:hypothetical protein
MKNLAFYFCILLGQLVPISLAAKEPGKNFDVLAVQLTGCWKSQDGLEFEEWMLAPNGWLIGYAMNTDEEGNVTFFEHMRIERSKIDSFKNPDVLVVSGGKDTSAVRFTRQMTGHHNRIRFFNMENDFPNYISYYPKPPVTLKAEISSATDSNKSVSFLKYRCEFD